MLVDITEASEAALAVAPLVQGSDERREIRQVRARDLGSSRQMLQAVGPGRIVPEDRSDAGFLGTREHGAGYRSRSRTNRLPSPCLLLSTPPALALAVFRLLHLQPLQCPPTDVR